MEDTSRTDVNASWECPGANPPQCGSQDKPNAEDEFGRTPQSNNPIDQNQPSSNHGKNDYLDAIEADISNAQDMLRRSIMVSFKEMKEKLDQDMESERVELQNYHSNEIARMQTTIDDCVVSMTESSHQSRRNAVVMENLSLFFIKRWTKQQLYWSSFQSSQRCFQSWKARSLFKKRQKQMIAVAAVHCRKRLQHKLFRSWQSTAFLAVLEKRLAKQQSEYEQSLTEMQENFTCQIYKLEEALKDAKEESETSQLRYRRLEDNLRQVFLRGVSAMNIEALSLFNETHHNHDVPKQEAVKEEKKPHSPSIMLDAKEELPDSDVPVPHPNVFMHDTAPVAVVNEMHERKAFENHQRRVSLFAAKAGMVTPEKRKMSLYQSSALRSNSVVPPDSLRSAQFVNAHASHSLNQSSSALDLSTDRNAHKLHTRPYHSQKLKRGHSKASHSAGAKKRHRALDEIKYKSWKSDQMDASYADTESRHSGQRDVYESSRRDLYIEDEDFVVDAYNQYRNDLQQKVSTPPSSTPSYRLMPNEPPEFYMVNPDNPESVPSSTRMPTRPTGSQQYRPGRSYAHESQESSQMPHNRGRVLRTRSSSSNGASSNVRAIYTNGKRPSMHRIQSKKPVRSSAADAIFEKRAEVFQQEKLRDECHRLSEAVRDLKARYSQEQTQRMKVAAKARRLEEISMLKDKRIESLMMNDTYNGDHSNKSVDGSSGNARERQQHTLIQKLRLKISQQSQEIVSYEDALQSLRSSTKSFYMMELEEEKNQLRAALEERDEAIAMLRKSINSQAKRIVEMAHFATESKQKISRLQMEVKKQEYETKKKADEVTFVRSKMDQMQAKFQQERRQRTYIRPTSSSSTSSTPLKEKILIRIATPRSVKEPPRSAKPKQTTPPRQDIHKPDKISASKSSTRESTRCLNNSEALVVKSEVLSRHDKSNAIVEKEMEIQENGIEDKSLTSSIKLDATSVDLLPSRVATTSYESQQDDVEQKINIEAENGNLETQGATDEDDVKGIDSKGHALPVELKVSVFRSELDVPSTIKSSTDDMGEESQKEKVEDVARLLEEMDAAMSVAMDTDSSDEYLHAAFRQEVKDRPATTNELDVNVDPFEGLLSKYHEKFEDEDEVETDLPHPPLAQKSMEDVDGHGTKIEGESDSMDIKSKVRLGVCYRFVKTVIEQSVSSYCKAHLIPDRTNLKADEN